MTRSAIDRHDPYADLAQRLSLDPRAVAAIAEEDARKAAEYRSALVSAGFAQLRKTDEPAETIPGLLVTETPIERRADWVPTSVVEKLLQQILDLQCEALEELRTIRRLHQTQPVSWEIPRVSSWEQPR